MQHKLIKSKDFEKSIVQIFIDHQYPSYTQPWFILKKEKSSGTGFCIEIENYMIDRYKSLNDKNKYILTNAHCVDHASYITIRKKGKAFLYKAKISDIIYECDLALLSIDTEFYTRSKQKKEIRKITHEFWNDLIPLKIGGLPSKLDTVFVYGYPLGGYNISITSGSVNRIQIIQYFESVLGIAIQIDAPINFGNSGGPVLDIHGKVIGVAFSGENDATSQNMGYIIPTILIRFFIMIIKNELKFDGICSLGIHYQELSNVSLRDFLKLKRDDNGILVTYIHNFGSSINILKKMDVITQINKKNIDYNGTMLLSDIIADNIT